MKQTDIGIKSSLLGVIANLSLFVVKFVVGTLFKSVAITADAMNNLSDLLSSGISLFGFKMAAKPADKEHPFGHRRFEYISGFLMSVIMLYIGIDVLRTSFMGVVNPSVLRLEALMGWAMLGSICVKGFLYFYYKNKVKMTQSSVLLAAQKDSRNDILISIGIVFGFAINKITHINADAYLGLLISIFIVVSSVQMLLGFMDELVGVRPSQDLINTVVKVIEKEEAVFSYHDLLLHEYGDKTYFGSIHIEVDQRMTLLDSHAIADTIEINVLDETGVNLVVHLDPIDVVSDEIKEMHQYIKDTLHTLDPRFTFHDLRIENHKVEMDVVLFEGCPYSESQITNILLLGLSQKYDLDITYDRVQLVDDI